MAVKKQAARLTDLGLLTWLLGRIAGVDQIKATEAPVAPLLSFTPFVGAAAFINAAISRRKSSLAIAAGFVAVLAPRVLKHRQVETAGETISVLTTNLLYGHASADEMVALVKRHNVDVLFVQELTAGEARRLEAAGLHQLLPNTNFATEGGKSNGAGIYARFPLKQGLDLQPIEFEQPTSQMTLPSGAVVELVCVRPHPPTPAFSRRRVAQWRTELGVLPEPDDTPVIMAGDFNATVDHTPVRTLLRSGFLDAATQTGDGWRPTWSWEHQPGLLTLDHVLVDPRCAVLETNVHKVEGTDHRALHAVIRLP